MADNISELMKKRAELDQMIANIQRESRAQAIAQVKALMAEYGLSPADLSSRTAPVRAEPTARVAPKYRDPNTGATWSGRGLQPKWFKAALAAGARLEELAVATQQH